MTRIENEFQSSLYRCTSDMVRSIAVEWITAGGSWDPETVAGFLSEYTDKQMADECVEGFGLDFIGDDDEPTHMTFNGYTAEDIAAEFREMRQ